MVVVTFLFFFVDKHNWKMRKLFRYCGQLLLGNRYVTLSKVYFWLVKAVQMITFAKRGLPMIQFGGIHNFQITVISPPLLPPSLHPPSPGKMVIKIFLTLVKWVIYLLNAFLMSLFSIVNLDFFLFVSFVQSVCLKFIIFSHTGTARSTKAPWNWCSQPVWLLLAFPKMCLSILV